MRSAVRGTAVHPITDRFAIDADPGKRGEKGRGRFHQIAVERDAAIADHPFNLSAAGDASAGEQFGYTVAFGAIFGF